MKLVAFSDINITEHVGCNQFVASTAVVMNVDGKKIFKDK